MHGEGAHYHECNLYNYNMIGDYCIPKYVLGGRVTTYHLAHTASVIKMYMLECTHHPPIEHVCPPKVK